MDKGLKVLFATYWSGGIWGENFPSREDYEQAKAEGYMFDHRPERTHDETLRNLRDILNKVSVEDVANAFLYSLSTRRLEYRSALGSYYYALAIPEHSHQESGTCHYCGWYPIHEVDSPDMEFAYDNVFNFERYKWGGVRHAQPEYALFDLEQFLLLPKVTPSEEDWAILKAILHAMRELPASKKAGAYCEWITKKKLLKSNKSEVETLLNILGICGVLAGEDAPCYCDCFVDVWHRAPREHTNDYAYPVNWWHVSDGVNEDRFLKVFGLRYSEL